VAIVAVDEVDMGLAGLSTPRERERAMVRERNLLHDKPHQSAHQSHRSAYPDRPLNKGVIQHTEDSQSINELISQLESTCPAEFTAVVKLQKTHFEKNK
jgi:hypothetical protein